MEGFECLTRSCSVAEFTEVSALTATLATNQSPDMAPIFQKLADVIIEWDLENEDGTPVPIAYAVCVASGKPGKPGERCEAHNSVEATQEPCKYDGLCAQDIDFAMNILMAWMNAVVAVPGPLQNGSSSGGIPAEVSQQLANLSKNLPNS